jgi:hypothetical protein
MNYKRGLSNLAMIRNDTCFTSASSVPNRSALRSTEIDN